MKRTANKLVHPIFHQINPYKCRIFVIITYQILGLDVCKVLRICIFLSCMSQCIFLLNIILDVLLSSAIICTLCEAIKHAFYKMNMKTETLKIILIRVNDNNVKDIK